MAKQAPFFSHDMNSRHDPKVKAMRGIYGQQGYGWFWTIVEMMAESDGYELNMVDEYVYDAYSMEMQTTPEVAEKFIQECIKRFKLFDTDGTVFWSETLRRRMSYRDSVREAKSRAGKASAAKRRTDVEHMLDEEATDVEHVSNIRSTDVEHVLNTIEQTKLNVINETKQERENVREALPPPPELSESIDKIIAYMNDKLGREVKVTDKIIRGQIEKRIDKDHRTLEDFYAVIDRQAVDLPRGAQNSSILNDVAFNKVFGQAKKPTKNSNEGKDLYFDCIYLSPEHYAELTGKYGKPAVDKYIQLVNNHKLNMKEPYRNDYAAISNWMIKDNVSQVAPAPVYREILTDGEPIRRTQNV